MNNADKGQIRMAKLDELEKQSRAFNAAFNAANNALSNNTDAAAAAANAYKLELKK